MKKWLVFQNYTGGTFLEDYDSETVATQRFENLKVSFPSSEIYLYEIRQKHEGKVEVGHFE